jgi:hypothetical protein
MAIVVRGALDAGEVDAGMVVRGTAVGGAVVAAVVGAAVRSLLQAAMSAAMGIDPAPSSDHRTMSRRLNCSPTSAQCGTGVLGLSRHDCSG